MEPRSIKAKRKVQEHLAHTSLAQPAFPTDLLTGALAEIRADHPFAFCSKRKIVPSEPVFHKEDQKQGEHPEHTEVPDNNTEVGVWCEPQGPLILSSSSSSLKYKVSRIDELVNRIISNPLVRPILIHVAHPDRTYRVPPTSFFMFSKVGKREASQFSRMATKLFPEPSASAAPGQFDFILLDPPWDNRSVRRSKMYDTRRRADNDPMQILQEMLSKHMAPGALVACWITNKASVRGVALQAFEMWGVELVEEWAWLKTTVHGEPICDIDGSMRRPYETLLIGKAFDVTFNPEDKPDTVKPAKTRVIVGVPDLHSRKPCLKELIEPMMPNMTDYRALEVFARNLTAGWWSWGDEVLKYNWEGCWTKAATQDNTDRGVMMEDGSIRCEGR
ncbi:MAG: hypothetical protein Q9166_003899 [cf. Caloplaca sp. 2 TL-2023]